MAKVKTFLLTDNNCVAGVQGHPRWSITASHGIPGDNDRLAVEHPVELCCMRLSMRLSICKSQKYKI